MSDKPPPIDTPFIRWFIITFSTREHFVRFIAFVIMMMTIHFIWRDRTIPEGWWGVFGMVVGYYFRGHSNDCEK